MSERWIGIEPTGRDWVTKKEVKKGSKKVRGNAKRHSLTWAEELAAIRRKIKEQRGKS